MSSLIKVSETNITSSVSSATITGIDTTYDVYMVRFNNLVLSSAGTQIRLRFTVSGTGDSSAKYDYAFIDIYSGSTTYPYPHTYIRDLTYGIIDNTTSTAGQSANGIIYCYGFNISTEYSWVNNVNSSLVAGPYIRARNGGQCLKVNQACDGLEFYPASGTIDSGDIVMYGLKKS